MFNASRGVARRRKVPDGGGITVGTDKPGSN